LAVSSVAQAAGDSLGGKMTANGCFADGRVAKSYITCVEKKASLQSGDFEFQLKAQAAYRDPVIGGGATYDQAAVFVELQLQDPKNILGALGELPVLVETTFCEDQWGCILTTEKQTVMLKRPYGYRMLKGRVDYLLPQDFKGGVTQSVTSIKVLLPGRSEQVQFNF
jgi:prepilin-type processing-associated H-X9-DG protein